MLIAGCVWLGAKERGAFGFSNEKSLMYCPSTLSCAWPCGALGPGAGPPLPPVVAIDSTSHCPQLPQSAAWLTQALRSDKDITRRAWTCAGARPPRSGIWCHSPGSSSMTRSSRGVRRELRASVANFAAAHRRTAGSNNAAPTRSVIKPGNIRRIPPTIVATPGVSKCSARTPSRAKAVRKRSRSARPNLLSNSTPAMEVAMKRPPAHNQPINAATRKKATNSAAGSTSSPINVHLTKDIGLIPAFALGISLVGATVGIVYGPEGATCAGGSAQASGSVRSRTYILVREPISAYADFLSAGFPLIGGSRHGGRERARRVRYLHHHLSGVGGVHLPPPAKRVGSAHGSRTAALRPVFGPRCGARCDQ